jgi:coenzyme PQQ synthesis protein D (PqqD)
VKAREPRAKSQTRTCRDRGHLLRRCSHNHFLLFLLEVTVPEQLALFVACGTPKWQPRSENDVHGKSELMALADEVRKVSNADGAVVLNLRHGKMFRLNPMGSRILDLLQHDTPLPEIGRQISTEFSVPVQVVERDVRDFVEQLRCHGVIDSPTEKV